jgi:hypothetical protein
MGQLASQTADSPASVPAEAEIRIPVPLLARELSGILIAIAAFADRVAADNPTCSCAATFDHIRSTAKRGLRLTREYEAFRSPLPADVGSLPAGRSTCVS